MWLNQIIFQLNSTAPHRDPPLTPQYVSPLNTRKIFKLQTIVVKLDIFSFSKSLGLQCLNVSLCSITPDLYSILMLRLLQH